MEAKGLIEILPEGRGELAHAAARSFDRDGPDLLRVRRVTFYVTGTTVMTPQLS